MTINVEVGFMPPLCVSVMMSERVLLMVTFKIMFAPARPRSDATTSIYSPLSVSRTDGTVSSAFQQCLVLLSYKTKNCKY